MKILVVDDERTLSKLEGAVYARTLLDAQAEYLLGPWDEIWLDHDLGPEEDIRPFVRLLELAGTLSAAIPHPLPRIRVLSMNPVGAQFITDSLQKYYEVQRVQVTDWL